MSNNRYEFKINADKTECEIFLLRPAGKYVGKVKADGQFELANKNIRWLPKLEVLAALGIRSVEAETQTLKELGF